MIRFLPALTLVSAALLAEPAATDVARFETAQEQFAHATELRRAQRGLEGQARNLAREAAVEAYVAVHEYHPEARELAVDAYFRAGELQRAGGMLNDALRLFQASTSLAKASPARERALLEAGHVQRRLCAYKDALATYELILHEKESAPKYRDRAMFWKARAFLSMQKVPDARRVLEGLANRTENPLMCVRAYDELALSALCEGDLEWAAGIIEKCRNAVAGPLKEETNLGNRVRAAFRRMRCRARLKAAITARRRTQTQR